MSLARSHRLWPGFLAAVVACALALPGAATAAASEGLDAPALATGSTARATGADVDPALLGRTGTVSVIVTEEHTGAASPGASAVSAVGGHVTQPLPLIGGFAATMPASAITSVAAAPGVRALTLDGKMQVQIDPAADATPAATPTPTPPSSPTTPADPATLPSVYRQVLGADALAAREANGNGVTIALVDTGVSPLPDIADRLVPVTTGAIGGNPTACVNFSGETTCNDQYGHGTFLAGLMAGTGAASDGQYRGTAPGARVLSLKLSGPDGSADVSKVLAAIQWVVTFRDQYGIRVLNLSLGTDSTQSYRTDPLNYAVEAAWRSGIVVAVAASNRGPTAGTIAKPGDDPYVLTVGAIDDRGTPATDDDLLPDFSSRGPTAADGLDKPDVVAPGSHLVSLAAPGSTISSTFPSTMAEPYRRGSGTSMATAAVSGLIADMLSADPKMTPDRVKYALAATARQTVVKDRRAVGAGLLDGSAAMVAPSGLANQGLDRSDGRGSLALSRGHVRVRLDSRGGNAVLDGEKTAALAQAQPAPWLGTSWTGTSWTGTSWTGTSWTGTSWTGTSWTGASWNGTSWTNNAWYGTSWTGSEWYGAWDQ